MESLRSFFTILTVFLERVPNAKDQPRNAPIILAPTGWYFMRVRSEASSDW